ncbi:MAG: hypothetical protein Q4F00_11345 [bacterium]|nr:hypothetical protein [bacterium]
MTVLLFGFIVSGCSEGDSTPAAVDYDAGGARLDVIVGMADAAADEDAAEKGFDVPSEAFNMVVTLIAGDKPAIKKSFAAEGSEWDGAGFWKDLGGGKVLMSSSISEEDIAGAELNDLSAITAVAVMVYDKDVKPVGTLCQDGVKLSEGGRSTVDFTAADAPAFKDAAALLADSSLLLATEPEAEDDVVTIAVGENVTVAASAVTALSEATSITVNVDPKNLVLSLAAETTALTVEGNVVTGVEAAEEAVGVKAVYTDPDDETAVLEASFSVMVEGGSESGSKLYVSNIDVDPDPCIYAAGATEDVWLRLTVYDSNEQRIASETVTLTFEFENSDGEIDTEGRWFTLGTVGDDWAISPAQDLPFGEYWVTAYAEGYEGWACSLFELIEEQK